MSLQMMKKAVVSVAAGAAMFTAISASAVTFVPATPNNPYTFSGETRLETPLGDYVCGLSLTGNVSEDPSDSTKGTVIVTGGTVSGAFPCGLITLENLPWGYDGNGTLTSTGASVNLTNIGASAPFNLLDCDGDITVPFINNSTASSFDLEGANFGTCTFAGDGTTNQNVLFADPSNNIQFLP